MGHKQSERFAAAFDAAERYERLHVLQGYYLEEEESGEEDADADFCEPCAAKEQQRRHAAGEPWKRLPSPASALHDTILRCDTCSADLYGRLTDYGAESEVDGFEREGFDPTDDQDCYFWSLCDVWPVGSAEWVRWLKAAGFTPADAGYPDEEG